MNHIKDWLSKGLLLVMLICMPMVPGCNCSGDIGGLEGFLGDEDGPVHMLTLTYPAGKSPNVFTEGWVFGAKCILNPGTKEEEDVSDQVEWSGSGEFSPEKGALCRPVFDGPGSNYITLTYSGDKINLTRTFRVNAVTPEGYAYVGCLGYCSADAHGCPACPHPAYGPITSGSPNVMINGKPAVRQGDPGVHSQAVCCGPNTFTIAEGDPQVLINGKPAARIGGKTQHCGGVGSIVDTIPSTSGDFNNWNEKHWRDLNARLNDMNLTLEERQSINKEIRTEKMRLQLQLQFNYDRQPANWRDLTPADPEYKQLEEIRAKTTEIKRRLTIVEGI